MYWNLLMNVKSILTVLMFLLNGVCQASELVDSDNNFKFLGTMGGDQKYLPSREKNQETYSRVFKPFGQLRIRDALSKNLSDMEECKKIGEDYSYTPLRLYDGRPFSMRPTSEPGGGFFLTLKESQEKESPLTSCQYALSTFGNKIEQLAGIPLQEIQKQCWHYGIGYIINQYFKCVSMPEDGNIVVYPNATEGKEAGVYRKSIPNWKSPYGGTIEVKPNGSEAYVFQADIFFSPWEWGDVAQFYTLKDPAELSLERSSLSFLHPYCTLREDGYFMFHQTDELNALRTEIDNTFESALYRKFPEIKSPGIVCTGVCCDFAFGKIFGTYSLPDFIKRMPSNADIEEHFEVTTDLQKAVLICHYRYPRGPAVHYECNLGNNYSEGKWGEGPVFQSPIPYKGKSCGDYFRCYKLKDESSLSCVGYWRS